MSLFSDTHDTHDETDIETSNERNQMATEDTDHIYQIYGRCRPIVIDTFEDSFLSSAPLDETAVVVTNYSMKCKDYNLKYWIHNKKCIETTTLTMPEGKFNVRLFECDTKTRKFYFAKFEYIERIFKCGDCYTRYNEHKAQYNICSNPNHMNDDGFCDLNIMPDFQYDTVMNLVIMPASKWQQNKCETLFSARFMFDQLKQLATQPDAYKYNEKTEYTLKRRVYPKLENTMCTIKMFKNQVVTQLSRFLHGDALHFIAEYI